MRDCYEKYQGNKGWLSQPIPEGAATEDDILKIFIEKKIIENVIELPPMIYLRKIIGKTFLNNLKIGLRKLRMAKKTC